QSPLRQSARQSGARVPCHEVPVRLSQGALSRHRQKWRAGVFAAGARQSVSRPRPTCVRMKGNGAKTAHDHWYSAGKSRPIRNSDAIEPTRQHQIMDLQRFPNYPLYFSLTPTGGPKPEESFSEVFFDIAMQQTPKPQTLAVVGADAEFPRNASDGVRSVAGRHGLKIVYDHFYPPATADFAPIVRAVAATN